MRTHDVDQTLHLEPVDLTGCLAHTAFPCLCPEHREGAPAAMIYLGRVLRPTRVAVGRAAFAWSWRAA